MSGEPLALTVVVPARDAAATLARTLDGLRHPEVAEVVVVDDGSTDRTAAVAAEWGARVVAGTGAGPSAARNLGARVVTTPLVAFCDADDDWIAPHPDPRLAVLAADPDLDGAWGTTICQIDGVDAEPTHLAALHGLVVRTAALRRVGDLDESMRLGEDVDWILRARRAGLQIRKLPTPCYRYRMTEGTASSAPGARAAGLLAAARRAARRAEPPAATAPVAVVIPAHDGERYLDEAIASVRSQRPAPEVVVVVDDGSTDRTAEVAAAAGAEVVRLGRSVGPNGARQAGIDATASELVAFCDADDRWTPDRLGVLLAALEAAPAAAGVIGRVRSFATPDRDVSHLEVPAEAQTGSVIGATLLRRAALDGIGGLRTDLLTGELVALERAWAERGERLVHLEEVVLERRVHGDNLTVRRADEVRQSYLRLAIEGLRARGDG